MGDFLSMRGRSFVAVFLCVSLGLHPVLAIEQSGDVEGQRKGLEDLGELAPQGERRLQKRAVQCMPRWPASVRPRAQPLIWQMRLVRCARMGPMPR